MHYISDTHGETQAGFDLMNQNSGNFAYDLIGNLVKDKAMEVASMSWTAYHKREKVVKENQDGTTTTITYRYDAMNNRIYKKAEGNGVTETTHYLRDGTGNTLAIYKNGELEELNIYGSSRLGTYNGKTENGKRTLGNKRYELSNHLGNALVVITDNKIGVDNGNGIADSYIAMVVSERDYLTFGAVMAGRSVENEDYTYSFNGKELDKSTGWQDYGFRDYNPVYKRFDSVDPLTFSYPELTPYQFASNRPISGSDLDGLEYDDRIEFDQQFGLLQLSVAQTIASIPQGFVRGVMNVFMAITGSNRRYHHKKGGGYWEFEGINREELDINDPDYLQKAGTQVLSDVGDIATVATGGSSKGMPSGSVFAKTGGKKVAANEIKKAADGITDGLTIKAKNVIEETKVGRGNITSQHTLNQDEAIAVGQKWIGKDYEVIDGDLFRSTKANADGTFNQYRIDNSSLSGAHPPNVPHIHLETIKIDKKVFKGVGGKETTITKDQVITNNHIPIE